jgi:glycosyltransferase involved in cell wall biosynthesis
MIKLSVNLVTKNRSQLLPKALDSILAQSYTDYEVVIINDGSTDETPAVIESYRNKFAAFQTFTNPKSLGVQAARQQALEASVAQYIAVLDDDDIWIEDQKLIKQLSLLESHPEIGIVGTGAEIYNKDNGKTNEWVPMLEDAQIRGSILYRAPFLNTTTLYRRDLALKVGGYDKSFRYSEDYLLWLKLGEVAQFANIPDVATRVISSEDGLTKNNAVGILGLALRFSIRFRKSYPAAGKAFIKLGIQYLFVLILGIKNWYRLKRLIWS